MPTYDYECQACGNKFEKFQMMSDRLLRKCPKCGKPKLERLIGAGGAVIFKGSGFYQTDYRSKGYADAAKADSAEPAPKTPAKDQPAPKDSTKEPTKEPAPPTPTPPPPPTKASKSAAKSKGKR
jgi:putative FmdB family regulatory protein